MKRGVGGGRLRNGQASHHLPEGASDQIARACHDNLGDWILADEMGWLRHEVRMPRDEAPVRVECALLWRVEYSRSAIIRGGVRE